MKLDTLSSYLHGRQSASPSPVLPLPLRRARGLLARWRTDLLALPIKSLARLGGTNEVILEVPRFGGSFEMDRRSHMFRTVVAGSFERHLAELVSSVVEVDDDIIDVGANIGLFTVLSARRASEGRVLAIEPSPGAAQLLKRNIARNLLSNVVVYEGAASRDAEGVTIHLSEGNEEYASVGGLNHPNAPTAQAKRVDVASDTLDRLVERHGLKPRFVKIDVEGAEGVVLEGATELLSHHRPVILSELDDRLLTALGHRAADVIDRLTKNDYRVYDAYRGDPITRPAEPYIGEILAIPESR